MSVANPEWLGAGFAHPAFGSQSVFRVALQALAEPGRVHRLAQAAELPAQGDAAACLLLLALLDADCQLWVSDGLRTGAAVRWLKFHTGCRLVEHPAQAQFAWFARGDAWPPLTDCASGSSSFPDQSTTCVMEVALDPQGTGWTLSGPGLAVPRTLGLGGLPADFAAQWQNNHQSFPQGVDLFLTTGAWLAGLPRSTLLQAAVAGAT